MSPDDPSHQGLAPARLAPIGHELVKGLGPIARDLGLDPARVLPLGAAGAPGHRWVQVGTDQAPVAGAFRGVDAELGADACLFVVVAGASGGAPDERPLAAWRNALWP